MGAAENYPKLGELKQEIYFLTVLEARVQNQYHRVEIKVLAEIKAAIF